jgi:predicted nucleic acid-binding protein
MNILDTDILSLLFAGHPRVAERFDREENEIVSTIISRIEILEGRFASVMKAEDGTRLMQAQERLRGSEEDDLPMVPLLPVDVPAAAEAPRQTPPELLRGS